MKPKRQLSGPNPAVGIEQSVAGGRRSTFSTLWISSEQLSTGLTQHSGAASPFYPTVSAKIGADGRAKEFDGARLHPMIRIRSV